MSPDFAPLGGFDPMLRWAGRAVPWRPGGAWSVTFGDGGAIVDQLADLIIDGRSRVAERYPAKAEPFAVTLGCVPWLTSDRIADALLDAGPHCICVAKGNAVYSATRRLLDRDKGVATYLIPRLRDTGSADAGGVPGRSQHLAPNNGGFLVEVPARQLSYAS